MHRYTEFVDDFVLLIWQQKHFGQFICLWFSHRTWASSISSILPVCVTWGPFASTPSVARITNQSSDSHPHAFDGFVQVISARSAHFLEVLCCCSQTSSQLQWASGRGKRGLYNRVLGQEAFLTWLNKYPVVLTPMALIGLSNPGEILAVFVFFTIVPIRVI